MKTYLIGTGIEHSASPALHRAWIKKFKLHATYEPIDTSDFADALDGIKGSARGANITAPFKELAVKACDELSNLASDARSVNTVVFEGNGAIVGHNTDIYGFMKGFGSVDPRTIKSTLLLGTGGAAKSVLYALLSHRSCENMNITLSGRNEDRARELAYSRMVDYEPWDLCDSDLRDYDLIINATGARDLAFDLSDTGAIIYDLTYGDDSAMTTEAKRNRLHSINGEEMLKHQAAKSFELWFGIDPLM